MREVVNGVMYVLSTGCAWRYVPRDLPPSGTLYGYLQRWRGVQTIVVCDATADPKSAFADLQNLLSRAKAA